MPPDILASLPQKPLAALVYRGETIHFPSLEHAKLFCDFIASKDRGSAEFQAEKPFLGMMPKEVIGKSDRPKVLKKMTKIIEMLASSRH